MKRKNMIEALVSLLIFLGITGCIGKQSYPLAARSGDTITVALGGTAWHEMVPGNEIVLSDLTVTLQQGGNAYPVKKRSVFRLFSDQTSYVSNFSPVYENKPVGQWCIALDLVDPVTSIPLPLAGDQQATLSVTSSKLTNNFWSSFEGSLDNIPLYILPGTGQSHTFNKISYLPWTDITRLQPLPQLALTFSGSGAVAAAALDIDYDETVISNSSYLAVRQDGAMPNVILSKRIYNDNGNMKMRLVLMTDQGTLTPDELKCFVVWDKSAVASGKTVIPETFTVTDSRLYDESGTELTGISVVKTLQYQSN